MEKRNRNIFILSIIALIALFTGLSFAYFSARITGLESASTLSLTAGRMGIVYSEDDARVEVSNIYPRSEAWITKQITLTGYNTTDQSMGYNLGVNVTTNTFTNGYLTYDLRLVSGTNGTPIQTKEGVPLNGTGKIKFGKGTFLAADGDAHVYELKIYFKDNGQDQNDAQNAVFNGKVYVEEYRKPELNRMFNVRLLDYDIPSTTDCIQQLEDWGFTTTQVTTLCNKGTITYEDSEDTYKIGDNILFVEDLVDAGIITNPVYEQGTIPNDGYFFEDGPYVYTYKYGRSFTLEEDIDTETSNVELLVEEKNIDGWGVALANPSSTAPITEPVLTAINGVPVTNLAGLFAESQATSIDLSGFDTSNEIDMSYMFYGSAATSLDLSSFDTSNVTNMQGMFYRSAATSLDLSSFDTSNVTNMEWMFAYSNIANLDLSSFDTSNVTSMEGMFYDSAATTLDLSSFDTSNVTNMESMFRHTAATSLDLSTFDTSNVTNMTDMFYYSAATTGYARTETDASRFNGTATLANGNTSKTYKPAALTFVVK